MRFPRTLGGVDGALALSWTSSWGLRPSRPVGKAFEKGSIDVLEPYSMMGHSCDDDGSHISSLAKAYVSIRFALFIRLIGGWALLPAGGASISLPYDLVDAYI